MNASDIKTASDILDSHFSCTNRGETIHHVDKLPESGVYISDRDRQFTDSGWCHFRISNIGSGDLVLGPTTYYSVELKSGEIRSITPT